ncbi:MAG: nucleoside phosphorylase [Pedosphaera sp.]|nr:nucleoside phosphorylase [Pedosphaera sp.]
MDQPATLVCFAVKEEAKFFNTTSTRVLITGMGQRNATESLHRLLASARPELVLTCGFAGGLNPKLPLGAVVFDEDAGAGLTAALLGSGAVAVKFHCATHVATTVAEKQALWQSTGADAVEMESSPMRAICKERGIPSATIRVISDTAHEDLPLDFNALMTRDDRINYAKLAWTILASPRTIPRLIKFREQTLLAARKLAEVLHQSLAHRRR